MVFAFSIVPRRAVKIVITRYFLIEQCVEMCGLFLGRRQKGL